MALGRTRAGRRLLAASLWLLPAGAVLPQNGSPAASVAKTNEAVAASASCLVRTLEHLGWHVERGNRGRFVIEVADPCDRDEPGAVLGEGRPRLVLPDDLADPRDSQAKLRLLLDHPATRCGYAHRLGAANRRAIDRLVANPGFRFSGLQTGWLGFGPGGAARDGWRRVDLFGRAFEPLAGNNDAIDAFHHGSVRAECGVGRQVAQLAAQAELYGEAFDHAFEAAELTIGTFNQLRSSRSVLLGSNAGEMIADGDAASASAQGAHAFAALPGFIVHVLSRDTLDDINNQAENFVVYEVDAAAASAMRAHGGFEHYNARNRELWELSRRLAPRGWRGWERLLHERDDALRQDLPPASRTVVERMDEILSDPFYSGFRIYVHRHGVKPVGFHIARLLDRNPRTPFRIELALHNVHTTLYRRYVRHLLADCMQHPMPDVDSRSPGPRSDSRSTSGMHPP